MNNKQPNIAFIDLAAQREFIGEKLDKAVLKVMHHGKFVMGPEVSEIEKELNLFSNSKNCISCASGTDALVIALMALNVRHGDYVLVPSFTFAASAEAVAIVGATPIFIDVEESTFNLSIESVNNSLKMASDKGWSVKAIIAVDLFGRPADYKSLNAIATKNNFAVIADSAQSFGGSVDGEMVGSLAEITTTSFFPAKPLGCCGDGGAIFCADKDLAETMTSIRLHGQGKVRYTHERIGITGRLDTIQAAVLLEKIKIFADEIDKRNAIAKRYNEGLSGLEFLTTPLISKGIKSAWAQYTVVVKNRDEFQKYCSDSGIPTGVYYPIPLHKQQAFDGCITDPKGLTATDNLAKSVVSLPMYPYLPQDKQDYIIETICKFK
jgi:dTDP-4-amino-4,6-dideoxygalactose transaminase